MEDKNSILRALNYNIIQKELGMTKVLRHNNSGCKKEKEIMKKHLELMYAELKKLNK